MHLAERYFFFLSFFFFLNNKRFLCYTVSGDTLPWLFQFRFWFMFPSSRPGAAVIWVQSTSVTGLEDQGSGSLTRLLASDSSSSPQSPLQRAPHAMVPPWLRVRAPRQRSSESEATGSSAFLWGYTFHCWAVPFTPKSVFLQFPPLS